MAFNLAIVLVNDKAIHIPAAAVPFACCPSVFRSECPEAFYVTSRKFERVMGVDMAGEPVSKFRGAPVKRSVGRHNAAKLIWFCTIAVMYADKNVVESKVMKPPWARVEGDPWVVFISHLQR